MPTLTICRGLPASGKTTHARAWVAEDPTHRARSNRDDLRAQLHHGEYRGQDTERQIIAVQHAAIRALLRQGVDVICDDTCLPSRTARDLRRVAVLAGAEFAVIDMTDVPLEECLRRNALREGRARVPDDTIRSMHERYIAGRPHPLPLADEVDLPGAADVVPYEPPAFRPTIREVDGLRMAAIPNSAYWATDDGGIFSDISGRCRRQTRSGTTKRLQVNIRLDGRLGTRGVHVLVCRAWHGPRPAGMVASHINGDQDDNRWVNLRWETQADNLVRRVAHGTDDRGLRNSRAAVTEDQVFQIRRKRWADGMTHEAIAAEVGVSRTTVTRILGGIRYAGSGGKAILVDIDGTVALHGSRSPYDETRVHEDRPNEPVIAAVLGMYVTGHRVVFCSGRTEGCREATEKWLCENVPVPYDALHMRPVGDMRKDAIVKREIFDRRIRDHYRVTAVFDDRQQVVDAWRALGLAVFQVAPGDF